MKQLIIILLLFISINTVAQTLSYDFGTGFYVKMLPNTNDNIVLVQNDAVEYNFNQQIGLDVYPDKKWRGRASLMGRVTINHYFYDQEILRLRPPQDSKLRSIGQYTIGVGLTDAKNYFFTFNFGFMGKRRGGTGYFDLKMPILRLNPISPTLGLKIGISDRNWGDWRKGQTTFVSLNLLFKHTPQVKYKDDEVDFFDFQ